MDKVDFQVNIADRFLQIRRDLYGDNNKKMAYEIGEDERVVSAICTGKRAPGLTTLLKLVASNPQVDANWLLVGRVPRADVRPYRADESEELASIVAEPPAEYGNPPAHHADGCPWERYDAAQQEIGSLRERLARASVTIATLSRDNSDLRKKTDSPSAPTPLEPTLI